MKEQDFAHSPALGNDHCLLTSNEKWLPKSRERPTLFVMDQAGNKTINRLNMLQEWKDKSGLLLIGCVSH